MAILIINFILPSLSIRSKSVLHVSGAVQGVLLLNKQVLKMYQLKKKLLKNQFRMTMKARKEAQKLRMLKKQMISVNLLKILIRMMKQLLILLYKPVKL